MYLHIVTCNGQMTKRCSLNVYCIDSEKNYIPEDQLLTCVLPDMLPLQVK